MLVFDELPEFGTRNLETLRQPLEDRVVTISRAQGALTFPASAGAQMGLSDRAYYRVWKISRTIADLAGEERIQVVHLAEALPYRPCARMVCMIDACQKMV